MGFNLEDYANFYEYFKTNVAQVVDEDEHNAIKKLQLSSESELLNKITTWYHLRSPHTNPNVTEMYKVHSNNPHWPDLDIIREKIEESFYKKTMIRLLYAIILINIRQLAEMEPLRSLS